MTSKSSIETLPLEVRQAVMSALPDIDSLKSMALSCSCFYRTSNSAQKTITTRVLFNEIQLDVLPEAVTVFEASRARFRLSMEGKLFLGEQLQTRKPAPQSWEVSDAISISKLHTLIRFFADDFARQCLESLALEHGVLQPPPSPLEMARIERALYRFEMYCKIFHDSKYPLLLDGEQKEYLFSNFSPCENEQLACIHNYLFGKIAPAFNEIAEHDIYWGSLGINNSYIRDPGEVEPILARGLSSIYSIIKANTYEERYKLFYHPGYPQYTASWLFEALTAANDFHDGDMLEDYSDEELARVTASFFEDPDTGPMDVWKWAYKEESSIQFINSHLRQDLRDWGYVMWDRARLDALEILKAPWDENRAAPSFPAFRSRHDTMREASLQRRTEIYRSGGRGWWDFDDESKVVYTRSSNQGSAKPKYREVGSLDEAKVFLSSLKFPPG